MPSSRIKATCTLDAETVRLLERLARLRRTSRSGVVRRAIELAARAERSLPRSRAMARQVDTDSRLRALDRFQESMTISDDEAAKWVPQIREERRAWPLRERE
jgi:predicted transcriptional regulator